MPPADVVVLDRDQAALGFARAAHERRGVDRLHAVEIDDADGDALLAEQVVRLERLEHRDARGRSPSPRHCPLRAAR